MRWRYGDTNPVMAAVDASTVIEIGDLVYQSTDDVRPASIQPGMGSDASDQIAFAGRFLGVAMQRSGEGETAPIRVATTGVFEFDCVPSTFELGDFIAPASSGMFLPLIDQQVAKVASYVQAIGRAARREPTETTRVLVDVRSTVMTGGVLGTTASS